MPSLRYSPGLPVFGMSLSFTGRGRYWSVRSSSHIWSRCALSRSPNCSTLSPSTPPPPRLAFTRSQAISRFFRLYTLSISECTFLSPVGLIQSASLLGRGCTGLSLMELFLVLALAHLAFCLVPTIFLGRLPRPTRTADHPVAWLSPRFEYYPPVRPLAACRFPFRLRLWGCFSRCHPRTRQVLLGSRADLPYRAVRKHLGAVGE